MKDAIKPEKAAPDPEAVITAFSRVEQEIVAGWLAEMGLPPAAWPTVPALRLLLETLAVVRASTEFDFEGYGDRIRAGAELLGLEDDDRRATHPGGKYLRNLRRWRRAADNLSAHATKAPRRVEDMEEEMLCR